MGGRWEGGLAFRGVILVIGVERVHSLSLLIIVYLCIHLCMTGGWGSFLAMEVRAKKGG